MESEEIRTLLLKIWSKMRRDYAESLRDYGLYAGQDHALCHLWNEDGVPQTRLCQLMGVEASTLTNMLNKLESYGLIVRVKDASDGRITRVHLTEAGRNLQKPVAAMWEKHQTKMLDGIDDEDTAILARLLRQMNKNLNS